MDIRMNTMLVIRKNREYLQGRSKFGNLIWSNSPYDAWQTRNIRNARKVAGKVGGELVLFNPIVGQLRLYGAENRKQERRNA